MATRRSPKESQTAAMHHIGSLIGKSEKKTVPYRLYSLVALTFAGSEKAKIRVVCNKLCLNVCWFPSGSISLFGPEGTAFF